MSVIISNVAVIVHNRFLQSVVKLGYLAAFRVNLADHMLSFNSGGLGMFGEQGIDCFSKWTVSFSPVVC